MGSRYSSAQALPQDSERLPTREQLIHEMLPLVYEELRSLASRYMTRESNRHTLQATALVHEAYLRIQRHDPHRLWDRSLFMATVAVAMRRILIERARRLRRHKHGGGRRSYPSLTQVLVQAPESSVDLLSLQEALTELSEIDPVKGQLVTLRYLVGCSISETAEALGLSEAKVRRDWTFSRAWLKRRLRDSPPERTER